MNSKITHSTLALFVLLIPALALGQYTPLVGIPDISDLNTGFDQYINTLYMLSISIAALLAVIKIIIAGVKWMMSDIVTTKSEAKDDIKNATIGLLIVMSAVLILTVINPQLTTTSVFVGTVDPKIAKTLSQSDASTLNLQPGDSVREMDNTQANIDDCQDSTTYGGTWYGAGFGNADTGWCVRRAGRSGVISEYSFCEENENSTSLADKYDCSAQEQACADSGGTYQQSISIEDELEMPNRISCKQPITIRNSCSSLPVSACDPLKTECLSQSGTWVAEVDGNITEIICTLN